MEKNPTPTKPTRVVHFCNQLSLGGTERTLEIFGKYLAKDPSKRYEIFTVSLEDSTPLLHRVKQTLGAIVGVRSAKAKIKNRALRMARKKNIEAAIGASHVLIAKDEEHLSQTLRKLQPDILHVHYSGNPEPPITDITVMREIPVTVTTNQFERENNSEGHRYVKNMLFVSNWLWQNKAIWAKNDPRAAVLYNPVEKPVTSDDLRKTLGIPSDAFVVGRVGRPDPGIHDPISLKAFSRLQQAASKERQTYFLALAAPPNMIQLAKDLKIQNFIALPSTVEDAFLSRFYNTLDVLAHARRDGETFGCNIAEAMIHGKTVISHLTEYMNAQTEIIGDTGVVCAFGDDVSYGAQLIKLYEDPAYCKELGNKAKLRATQNFEAQVLTHKLSDLYERHLKSNQTRREK